MKSYNLRIRIVWLFSVSLLPFFYPINPHLQPVLLFPSPGMIHIFAIVAAAAL
jgi:hypothetical protein